MIFSLWDECLPLNELLSQLGRQGMDASVAEETARQWIIRQALADYGVQVELGQVQETMRHLRRQLRLDTPERFALWLAKESLTEELLQQRTAQQMALRQLKQVLITLAEIEEHFLNQKARLEGVLFGIIEVANPQEAERVYQALSDGQDFFRLAQEHSNHATAPRGGMVGPEAIMKLQHSVRDKLLALNPGEVCRPFAVSEGKFRILRLYAYKEVLLTPELEEQCREQLFQAWLTRQIKLAQARFLNTPALIPA